MSPEWVRAWKPVVPGVREVFHARFVDYAYPPHVHDTWTVFIVDDGWIRYDLDTHARGAGGDPVTILPPHVVHDGRAAVRGGFRKRVLYLGTDVLDERLTGRAVDAPDVQEPTLRSRHPAKLAGDLRDLLDVRLFERTTLSEAGSALGASPTHLVRSFTQTFGIAPHRYVVARRIDAARKRLLEGEPIALVAAGVGFYDQAHFTRQFKRHVGTPPGR
jgi:AraC-like DNA-binding protein